MTAGVMLIIGIIAAIIIAVGRFHSMPQGTGRVVMLTISIIGIFLLLVMLIGIMVSGNAGMPVFQRGYR